MRSLLAILFLALALAGGIPAHAASDDDMTPTERYELGMRLMKRGYYTRALEELNRVRNYHRDDPASVKAELAIAELYYRKGDYEQARLAFEDFARLHVDVSVMVGAGDEPLPPFEPPAPLAPLPAAEAAPLAMEQAPKDKPAGA